MIGSALLLTKIDRALIHNSAIMIPLFSIIAGGGSILLTIVITKLANEKWNIHFDSQKITIKSHSNLETTYTIKQLVFIDLLNDKTILGQTCGIRFIFYKLKDQTLIFDNHFYFEKTIFIFSSQAKRQNFISFKQFVDDIEQYIIESNFKLVDIQKTKIIITGHINYRKPAMKRYQNKNT